MNIENDIFKRSRTIFNKLEPYGFKKEKTNYIYETAFLDNTFKAIITIDKNSTVTGKVIDVSYNEEYLGLRTEMQGEFVNNVREEYKNILYDIKKNCFEEKYFISNQANRLAQYIKEKYHNDPEFLWEKAKGSAVFRNSTNKKWYGIIMPLDLSKLDDGRGEVEIINVKLAESKILDLLKEKGYYKAYHMNKKDWISIILNDTLPDNTIIELINASYDLIAKRSNK